MNTLVKKEIRLLLPVWLTAMLLAVGTSLYSSFGDLLPILATLFGMAILAVASFGREFAGGTFGMLLTQPIPRQQLWSAKLLVLVAALATVMFACVISGGMSFHLFIGKAAIATIPIAAALAIAGGFCFSLLTRQTAPALAFTVLIPTAIVLQTLFVFDRLRIEGPIVLATVATILAVSAGFGIYWSLQLFAGVEESSAATASIGVFSRQGSRAMASVCPMSRRYRPLLAVLRKELGLQSTLLVGMAGLFILQLAVLGFRCSLAHSQGSLGKDIDAFLTGFGLLWFLPPLLIAATSIAEERRLGTLDSQRCLPVAGWQQYVLKFLVVLLCGGVLSATLLYLAETIGMKWGLQHQFLNPLLGYFSFDEYNARNPLGLLDTTVPMWSSMSPAQQLVGLILIFCSVAGISFYVATFAKSMLAALGLSAVLSLLASAVYSLRFAKYSFFAFGFSIWPLPLGIYCSIAVLVFALPLLGWQNLHGRQNTLRVLIRNLSGFTLALVLAFGLTLAIYFRTWECVLPSQTQHSAPRLSLAQDPPRLSIAHRNRYDSPDHTSRKMLRRDPWSESDPICSLIFPDGRLWVATWTYRHDPPAPDYTPKFEYGHFLAGDNWADAALARHTVIGLRKDGTLWSAEIPFASRDTSPKALAAARSQPPVMRQVGSDSHWKTVVALDWFALLLRDDGSLWFWGPSDDASIMAFRNPFPPEQYAGRPGPTELRASIWPGLDAFPISPIDTTTKWTGLRKRQWSSPPIRAEDQDGREWSIVPGYDFNPPNTIVRAPAPLLGRSMDREEIWPVNLRAFRYAHEPLEMPDGRRSKSTWYLDGNQATGAIAQDGTLWAFQPKFKSRQAREEFTPIQISAETDWRSIIDVSLPVALKTNGTLWTCYYSNKSDAVWSGRWRRFDSHKDWVGIYGSSFSFALAADGSLWQMQYAPERVRKASWLPEVMLAPSSPQLLGNIFTPLPGGNTETSKSPTP